MEFNVTFVEISVSFGCSFDVWIAIDVCVAFILLK
jgi:hypothetical protein